MPFVDVRTPIKFNDHDLKELQVGLLDIVSEEMNKGIDTIMIGVKDKYRLTIGRQVILHGAFIEINVYKQASDSAKKNVCKRINELLVGSFGLKEDEIYIIFEEKEVWGYKGEYLS